MWELRDEVTNKVIFVGNESECMEYSKKFPEVNYIMVECKKVKDKEIEHG